MASKKIGILSGTFDPIHDGHLALANLGLTELKLHEVWLVPEAIPRHKTPFAKHEHRIEMAKLVAGESLRLKVISDDLLPESHSIETLRILRSIHPGAAFTLLMGDEVMQHLHQWDYIEEIVQMVSLGVIARSGLESGIAVRGAIVTPIRGTTPSYSSSMARHDIRAARVPAIVRDYIEKHRLYRSKPADDN